MDPVFPVAPFAPVRASAHVNCFEKDLPSTVTGTTSAPLFVVSVVAALTVKYADVVPFDEIDVVSPVTCPVMVPIVAATCVPPL